PFRESLQPFRSLHLDRLRLFGPQPAEVGPRHDLFDVARDLLVVPEELVVALLCHGVVAQGQTDCHPREADPQPAQIFTEFLQMSSRTVSSLLKNGTVPFRWVTVPVRIDTAGRDSPLFNPHVPWVTSYVTSRKPQIRREFSIGDIEIPYMTSKKK